MTTLEEITLKHQAHLLAHKMPKVDNSRYQSDLAAIWQKLETIEKILQDIYEQAKTLDSAILVLQQGNRETG
jgi:hypothetical protein